MKKIGTITFSGKSGNKFKFDVYNLDSEWEEVSGVYMVTERYEKPDGKKSHKRVYIGETGNLKNRFTDHHKQDCFDENNANALCWLSESDEDKRLEIEDDLIQAKSPPCND